MTFVGAPRIVLFVIAAASLTAGFSGGLGRFGLFPVAGTPAEFHGALMIGGFFGMLISLERAVADGRPIMLSIPALVAVGSVLLMSGWMVPGVVTWLLAGVGLTALTAFTAIRLPALFTAVLALAATLWPIGTTCWLVGWMPSEVAYTWLAFLILTITAERIELARLTRPGSVAVWGLGALLALLLLALGLGQPWTGTGMLAVSLGGLGLWLSVNDVALVTVRSRGLSRFSAVCLLVGYGWLIIAAALLLLVPPQSTALGHDAVIHAIGVGFVMSMVFAHAPIILPAVTGARVRYVPLLYGPLLGLQCAVVLRTVGDVTEVGDVSSAGALVTTAALISYAAILASTTWQGSARHFVRTGPLDQGRPEGNAP